jgi:hypothetical protein
MTTRKKRSKPARKAPTQIPPQEIEEIMGKPVPVRKLPPNRGGRVAAQGGAWENMDPIERLSDMEKLSVQLDLNAGLPKSRVASKYGLSSRQVTKVGKMSLNLSGQMRERLEATATTLVTHAHRMFDSIDDDKIKRAGLSQLSISGAIAIDKALLIDKHLHGSQDNSGDLILNFGSREALEKAIVKKFKDNPLFKLMKAKETEAHVVDATDVESKPVDTVEQLDLFPGTEEKGTKPDEPAVVSFAGRDLMAPNMLSPRKQPSIDKVKDRQIEMDLDQDWGER